MPDQNVLFQSLFEHSKDGVLLTQPTGEILRANPAACRALRMNEEEIRRRGRVGIIVSEEGLERLLAERERSGVVQGELSFRRGDGGTFPAEFTSVLLPTVTQEMLTYVIFRDISERRRAESMLREQAAEIALHRHRLVEALDGSALGHWEWDLRSGRTTYGAAWPALLSYGPNEIEPSYVAWAKLVHPDDVARVNDDIVAHLKGRSSQIDTEYRMRARGGEWRWIHTRARVVEWGESRRAVRIAGTHADVTRRREAEDGLRQALAENEKLVADLRTALDNVKTLSGLLPVCAWCRRIRSDKGHWVPIEQYVSERSEAKFTHGMCPECFEKTKQS